MYELIQRRIGFNPIPWNWLIIIGLILVWTLIVLCAVNSIVRQAWKKPQQKLWIWVVTAVPLLGLLCYLPFSFESDRNAYMLAWKKHGKSKIPGKLSGPDNESPAAGD